MTDRVMLDLETLGVEPGAAICSLGAVRFDAGGLGKTYYGEIDLPSCEAAGLTIDAGTLEWWLGQDDEAAAVLAGGESLETILATFGEWYADADEVWANSPTFDCELLEAAYEAVSMEPPWNYWEWRDYRTLKKLPGAADLEHEGVEHDALDDAEYQAQVAARTLATLQEWAGEEADR